MSLVQAIGLLLVGTAAGFDLVSGPQVLLARPIVVGALSGAILGDVPAGLLVGGTMELFALEVLPVGATRYPDHGPGVVAGVWLLATAGSEWSGAALLVALVCSELGGGSLRWLRRANGRALTRIDARLSAGDPAASSVLQFGGAARDLARGLSLTLVGFGIARGVGVLDPHRFDVGRGLFASVLAVGFAGAVAGAFRTAGRSWRGVVLGIALVAGWFVGGYGPVVAHGGLP